MNLADLILAVEELRALPPVAVRFVLAPDVYATLRATLPPTGGSQLLVSCVPVLEEPCLRAGDGFVEMGDGSIRRVCGKPEAPPVDVRMPVEMPFPFLGFSIAPETSGASPVQADDENPGSAGESR